MNGEKYILFRVIIIIIILFIGCGKKSSNSTTSTKTVSFTSSNAPSDNSVYLEEVSKNNDEVTLAAQIKGGSDVFGTAIEIKFDGSKVSFVSAEEGIYFNQGTVGTSTFSANLEQGDSSILLIGINRKVDVRGVPGDGILCRIVFKALAEQTDTPISFNTVNSSLYDSGKVSRGNSWIGGSLSYK